VEGTFLERNVHVAKLTPIWLHIHPPNVNPFRCNFEDAIVQSLSDEMVHSGRGARNIKKAIVCNTSLEFQVAKDVIVTLRKR
jgi:hypothetical protein